MKKHDNVHFGNNFDNCNFVGNDMSTKVYYGNDKDEEEDDDCCYAEEVVEATATTGEVAEIVPRESASRAASAKKKEDRELSALLLINEEEQARWAGVFLRFLKGHKMSEVEFSTSARNYANRLLACFIREWEKLGLLNPEREGMAPSRFLFEDCGLRGIAMKSHGNCCSSNDEKKGRLMERALEYEDGQPRSTMAVEVEEVVKRVHATIVLPKKNQRA